jgi:hypothetical protein
MKCYLRSFSLVYKDIFHLSVEFSLVAKSFTILCSLYEETLLGLKKFKE